MLRLAAVLAAALLCATPAHAKGPTPGGSGLPPSAPCSFDATYKMKTEAIAAAINAMAKSSASMTAKYQTTQDQIKELRATVAVKRAIVDRQQQQITRRLVLLAKKKAACPGMYADKHSQ